jgi:hypothetical protein
MDDSAIEAISNKRTLAFDNSCVNLKAVGRAAEAAPLLTEVVKISVSRGTSTYMS